MDPLLLTTPGFWNDSAPFTAGGLSDDAPGNSELRGHVLFETSGTSGSPKWIALSKHALLASAVAVNKHLDVRSSSRWGLALPAHHVGGFGVAARAFSAGCPMHVFGQRWEPLDFAGWLADRGITHTTLVPTQVHDLVAADLRAPAKLSAIVVGGGQLDMDTGRAARSLGWPVLASYGMTEAASQIATQGLELLDSPYQTSPIPLLPIWQAETSAGQLLRITGPALFSGMAVRSGDSWVFHPREQDWYQTQDRVHLTDRLLTPLGRADTLIKILGELVDPEKIERELLSLSDGMLAPGSYVVIAIPDARAEHALVPVFERAADTDVVIATLAAHAALSPGFCRLRPPVILEKLPRSPLGKPRRAEIQALLLGNSSCIYTDCQKFLRK